MLSFEDFMRQNNDNRITKLGSLGDSGVNDSINLSASSLPSRVSGYGAGRGGGVRLAGNDNDVSGVLYEDPDDSSVIEDTSFYKSNSVAKGLVNSNDNNNNDKYNSYGNSGKNIEVSGLEVTNDDDVEYDEDFEDETPKKQIDGSSSGASMYSFSAGDSVALNDTNAAANIVIDNKRNDRNNDNHYKENYVINESIERDNNFNNNQYERSEPDIGTPNQNNNDSNNESYVNDFYVSPFTPAPAPVEGGGSPSNHHGGRLGINQSINSTYKANVIAINSDGTPLNESKPSRNSASQSSSMSINSSIRYGANRQDQSARSTISMTKSNRVLSSSATSTSALPLASNIKVVLNHKDIPGLSAVNEKHDINSKLSPSKQSEEYIRRDEIDLYIKQSIERHRKSGFSHDNIDDISIPIKSSSNALSRGDVIRTGMYSPATNTQPSRDRAALMTSLDSTEPIDFIDDYYRTIKGETAGAGGLSTGDGRGSQKDKYTKPISQPSIHSKEISISQPISYNSEKYNKSVESNLVDNNFDALFKQTSYSDNNNQALLAPNQYEHKDDFKTFLQLSLAHPEAAQSCEDHLSGLMSEIIDVCQRRGRDCASAAEIQMHRVILEELQQVLFAPGKTKNLMLRMLESYVEIDSLTNYAPNKNTIKTSNSKASVGYGKKK